MNKTVSLELPKDIYQRLEQLARSEKQQAKDYLVTLIAAAEAKLTWEKDIKVFTDSVLKNGSEFNSLSKEEIIAKLRKSRQEVFESEYAHLYR